ncbi:MAG: ROK family protein [Planctomycetota bacterium]
MPATETPPNPQLALGIDLGGTSARIGLVNLASGAVTARDSFPTGRDAEPSAVFDRMAEAAHRVCAAAGVALTSLTTAGLGAPGPLSPHDGVIHLSPNLPKWNDVPAAEELSRRLGLPATLQNDACCAAWGEFQAGAARQTAVSLTFTLGTGVGGAVIANGDLVEGPDGTAGHLGHVHVRPDAPQCLCGATGCLEATLAAARLVEAYRARGGSADSAADIADAAALEEPKALETFAGAGADLGVVCASLVNALNPEVIVIAGGVAGAFAWIAPAVRAAIDTRAFEVPAKRVRVVRGALGPDAGVVGAASWAARKHRQSAEASTQTAGSGEGTA